MDISKYTYSELVSELKDCISLFEYQFDPYDERRGGYNHDEIFEFEGLSESVISSIKEFITFGTEKEKEELLGLIEEYLNNVQSYKSDCPFEDSYKIKDDVNMLQEIWKNESNKNIELKL